MIEWELIGLNIEFFPRMYKDFFHKMIYKYNTSVSKICEEDVAEMLQHVNKVVVTNRMISRLLSMPVIDKSRIFY